MYTANSSVMQCVHTYVALGSEQYGEGSHLYLNMATCVQYTHVHSTSHSLLYILYVQIMNMHELSTLYTRSRN